MNLAELFRATPDPPIDRAALVLARDEHPRLDVDAWLGRLDALAAPLRTRVAGLWEPAEQAAVLGEYVYGELGFRGNKASFYDPRNSYLDDVIVRRTGIPITLAVVLIALGTRAGLAVEGVGFPGHFLVRLGGTAGVFADPFEDARVLSADTLRALARRSLGPRAVVTAEHLAPVGSRAMAARMLTNLKGVYEDRGDHARALVVCDRLVDLAGTPELRRDRGMHALALGAKAAAQADLEAYLAARPDAADAKQVRAAVARAHEGARGRGNLQ